MTGRELDSTADSVRVQEAAHAAMGAEGRVRAALEMSEAVRAIRMAGLHFTKPKATRYELMQLFVLEAHGVRMEPE